MFDKDLAELYGVETRTLNQAVKRNRERFPNDFMFQLNEKETRTWQQEYSRSQFVTLKKGQNIKYAPYVFTEQGVAMLSSVLRSSRAIQMNIQVIRTFTKLREILSENKLLAEKLESLEQKYDGQIAEIFEALRYLVTEKVKQKTPIGFRTR
jgi:phage regulator Rha-like protein